VNLLRVGVPCLLAVFKGGDLVHGRLLKLRKISDATV
jgi:hypothetical protein